MLQSIDTLIAFVVIMTVASLFVTVLVQMMSAALSLRGKNLANALSLTFQTIAPSLGAEAHALAARILSDPLLSDSTMTDKDKRDATTGESRHKPWAFGDVSCAMQLSTAVRAEEVYATLKRLATAVRQTSDQAHAGGALRSVDERTARAAQRVLDALVIPQDDAALIKTRLNDFVQIAEQITDAPVREKLLAMVEDTPANLMVQADAAREKFASWFGSAQDRAQQWFQLHTRSLAIVASIVVALILQLDAVEIFHFVSTNAASRAALVAQAATTMQQADGALDERGGLLRRIADAWARESGQPPADLSGVIHLGQLQERLAATPNFDAAKFEDMVKRETLTYYRDQREKLTELTRGVSATGFEFIPVGYWRWPVDGGIAGHLKKVGRHLPGIAICAALLTLGAPYWYNLLKNLASLRPAVAQLISKENEEARATTKT